MGDQTIDLDLSMGPAGPEGYECWDATRCKLCSRFRDRATIHELLLTNFVTLGETGDLWRWSQEGERCMLCVYIIIRFLQELGSVENFASDADFIVRWTPGKDPFYDFSQVLQVEFEMSWGFPNVQARHVVMNVFTQETESAAPLFAYRPPNPVPASPSAFTKAKQWIEMCDSKHECCIANTLVELPKRLLEISGTNPMDAKVRLCETEGQHGRYLALSYAWGDPKDQLLTTLANYGAHLKDIEVNDMAASVADAVFVTLSLGFKYLWVDALCIVQDSKEDKLSQIGDMARVYKNANVTISAASSSGASKGFTGVRQNMIALFNSGWRSIPIHSMELAVT